MRTKTESVSFITTGIAHFTVAHKQLLREGIKKLNWILALRNLTYFLWKKKNT